MVIGSSFLVVSTTPTGSARSTRSAALPTRPGCPTLWGRRVEIDEPAGIVARAAELAAVEGFLDAIPAGSASFVIDGEAGIGKSTIWTAGTVSARRRLYWVLVSRPVEAETKMSYAVLGDLLEPVLEETLPKLPHPQRHALQ